MRTTAFALMLTLCSLTCHANIYHQADTHQQKDGLSSNNVRCIFKDSMGFMWFGTDNGIDIYDAAEISSVRKTGLGVNSIAEVAGRIYIASASGLYEYDRSADDIVKFNNRTTFGIEIASPVSKVFSAGNILV